MLTLLDDARLVFQLLGLGVFVIVGRTVKLFLEGGLLAALLLGGWRHGRTGRKRRRSRDMLLKERLWNPAQEDQNEGATSLKKNVFPSVLPVQPFMKLVCLHDPSYVIP